MSRKWPWDPPAGALDRSLAELRAELEATLITQAQAEKEKRSLPIRYLTKELLTKPYRENLPYTRAVKQLT